LYLASRAALEKEYGEAAVPFAMATAGRQDMWGHNMMQEQGAFGADPADGEGRD